MINAAFGLTVISDVLIARQFWLRLLGGAILCVLGVKTLMSEPHEKEDLPKSIKLYSGMYISTIFLTLTNPMTIFSFAAVFAGLGLAGAKGSVESAGSLVLGVFFGSGLWRLFLVGLFMLFKRRFLHHELQWVNRLAGVVITVFGVFVLLRLL